MTSSAVANAKPQAKPYKLSDGRGMLLGKRTWVEHYRVKVEAWMVNDVYPYIGGRPVAELSAPEFLRVVRRMEERGAIESAHRVLQTCGR